jgi:lipopolysaccharide heptosyltransferase III
VLQRLPENARVAVIRIRSLGDCVLTTPALSILKNARPDLRIAVAVESRFAAIFEGNPAVSQLLEPSLTSVCGFHPDLCLNLHGGTRSICMTAGSFASHRAGFAHHKGSWIYNHPIPRAQEILGVDRPVHTAEHLASAMFYLGAPRTEIPRASLFAESPSESHGYAIIHPVAATEAKTWSADGFVKVAEHLARDHDLEPIFIGGPGDDLSSFGKFRRIAGAPLQQTKSLMKGASLFVGNDSGPAHMAAAFGVPVVVLFGPSDSVTWAPWRTVSQVLVDKTDIKRISFEDVIAATERLKVRA